MPNKLLPKILPKIILPLFLPRWRILIGISFWILCFLGRPVLAYSAEDFDPHKLQELELIQTDLINEADLQARESEEAKAVEGKLKGTSKKKTPDKEPSQKGYYRVQDREIEKPNEQSREAIEAMLQPEKKTLRDRLGFYIDSNLNYDSNVFSTRQARGDFYYQVTPGITIDATKLYKQLGFNMGIGCTWRQYFSFARLNSWSPNLNFDFPGTGQKFRIGKKITMSVNTGISFTPKGVGDSQDSSMFTDSIRPYLGINLNYLISQKFSVGFDYNASIYSTGSTVETATGTETLDTGNKKTLIVTDQSIAIRPRYHITPKTSVFLGYSMGMTRANSSEDAYFSDYMRLTTGIDGKITAKSVASLETGWERRTYKAGRVASNTLYLQAAYLVQLTRKWSASVTAVHDMNPSIVAQTNLYTSSSLNLGVNFKPVPKWTWGVNAYGRWDQAENNTNIENNLTPDVETDSGKQDNFTFGFTTSLRYYAKRWLSMGLSYTFDKRWANEIENSYLKHVGTFDVNVHI